jgi:uncharacterized membrane protein
MTNKVVSSYIKYNFLRVAEILVILASVFFTMQFNIQTQGEMLKGLQSKNEQMTVILNGLVVSVATIQSEQGHIQQDLDRLRTKVYD